MRVLREPLVHFIFLSLAIFAVYHLMNTNRQTAEQTIVVTSSDLERLSLLYTAETNTQPTQQDMQAIVKDYVHQEALAREARRLGMADHDTVVQRRLVQKMMFMLSDVSKIERPSDAVLEDWLEANPEKFAEPTLLSFDHVFFSSKTDARIDDVRSNLNEVSQSEWRDLGDPFMLQRSYSYLTQTDIARLFGQKFSETITMFAPEEDGVWMGPISSALGTHLVRITNRTSGRMPLLSEVKPAVMQDWQEYQKRKKTTEEIAEIVGQYDIVVEGSTDK